MYIVNCLMQEHELQYLVAAVLVCSIGSVLFINLLGRAKSYSGMTRLNWVFLSGIVGGCMIWTTHFSAMVGFSPSITHSYDPFVTALALGFAIASLTVASAAFACEDRGSLIECSGLLIGLSMVGVHYLGMYAYNVQGTVEWDLPTMGVALCISLVCGALTTNRLGRPYGRWCKYGSVSALVIGVLSMHFSSMAAMTITPDPSILITAPLMPDSVLMLAVLSIMTLLLVCGWIFYFIDASTEQQARTRFEHLENHDPLTGLANRTGLHKALETYLGDATYRGRGIGVLCFDFRRFRNVNNVHGFAAGDEIMRLVTKRITKKFGDEILLARVGGDEFVAVFPDVGMVEVTSFAHRLITAVSQPIIWRAKPVIVETNVGVSLYPTDGRTADVLLSRAFLALGRARKASASIAYHDEKRDAAMREQSALALDLRHAIERGELKLHYQRQNSVVTRELIGFEVLLRWEHPELGMVPPSQFIPIAEAYGYISAIGEWALRTACLEAAQWPRPYKIGVNVAPDQLSDPRLPEIVADALAKSGLPASRLELEMTESGIVADPEYTREIIVRLKAMGVSLAMDDYGTGSSSLSTLQSFPFDKIKIDKSFITEVGSNPQAAAIVRSTIILGKSLKIPILAEGVESECALKFLRRVGCSEVQGFLFGKPMPASAISEISG
ncbi:EAL domain-containing protein [Agrobacterium rubi]|nr:EAL domain-containing protein [Agrobacterium rubi]NTF24854.1 EAL domain-containing protein [Agrobacterium rubi]